MCIRDRGWIDRIYLERASMLPFRLETIDSKYLDAQRHLTISKHGQVLHVLWLQRSSRFNQDQEFTLDLSAHKSHKCIQQSMNRFSHVYINTYQPVSAKCVFRRKGREVSFTFFCNCKSSQICAKYSKKKWFNNCLGSHRIDW